MAKKTALKIKNKETAKAPLPRGKSQSHPKKVASPETQEAHERAQWQKEKRVYWSSRFRHVMEEITTKPKVKKSNSL